MRLKTTNTQKGFYLPGNIYPWYSTFVKTIPNPKGNKKITCCNKDVERAFGVLQTHFAIVRQPARTWSIATMRKVMTACVIMHNMVLEDAQECKMEPMN
jgi:hypothetical protein